MKNNIEIGKYLAYILRHRPDTAGIKLDKNGYCSISIILECISSKFETDFTLGDLHSLVDRDSKKRYKIDPKRQLIKANQGHSVEIEHEFKKVTPFNRPKQLFHGTAEKYIKSILSQGLKKKNRHHVHMSDKYDTAVATGDRHGVPVVIEIDLTQMLDDNIDVFVSDNGVYLTDYVDRKYFKQLIRK